MKSKRCSNCRHWKPLTGEVIVITDGVVSTQSGPDVGHGPAGLCQHEKRANWPREMRLFGAGGVCGSFETIKAKPK